METKKTNRILWVDELKGFAIILVMCVHAIFPNIVKIEMCSFALPMFFFLSGYVFSIRKYDSFKSFLQSKIRSLIIPLMSFSIFIFVFDFIVRYLILGTMNLKNVLFEIPGFFIQIRGTFLGGSLWFLPCLFVTEIIFYFIIKITKNNKVKILFSIAICAVVGSIYFKYINKLLPWSVDAALTAILFLGIGYLSKNTKKKFDKIVDIRIAILLLIINICSTYFNYKILGSNVDLYACRQGNVLLYYIESISGIYMCISIKRLIKSSNILISIGKNSLIYYCLHGSLFVVFRSIISNFTSIENCNFIKSLAIGITMIVLAVIIIWNISNFINKKCPFILGKINICNDNKG